jgi:3-phenylpropionate/trans-cinnamate dioxygenase ferredoxin component
MAASEQNASRGGDGWVEVGSIGDIEREDVKRFDFGDRTFAIYCAPDGQHYATDGICTHEYAHLANGLVLDHIVECPKHNGRFDYRTGAAKGAPACVNLRTYPMKVDGKTLLIKPD